MVVKTTTVRRNVRILLVGERGVGKTSLILALASEDFPDEVPNRAEEITIPAEVTPEKVPTNIVDFSFAVQNDEQLHEEIVKANVICIVYSVIDNESFNKISSYWLPLIRNLRSFHKCPIILVGNKADMSDYDTIDEAVLLMESNFEIESCVECSAKTLKNISEMFYYAQRSVLHPTEPIFDPVAEELTDNCKKALTRIFKICDFDNDELLNDAELNNFQKLCFSINLHQQTLDEVKAVLKQCPNNEGIKNESVTLNGFLYLHRLFLLRGRNETIWSVLRKFGYDNQLNFNKDYIRPKLKIATGCSVELSKMGLTFLSFLFEKFDKRKTGYLSKRRLKEMFSVCPRVPWESDFGANVVKCDKGQLGNKGFVHHWILMTYYDPFLTLEYLAYLGYSAYDNECQTSAVRVTREKKIDLAKQQSARNVYVCHVIGAKGCGKSMLCECFLRKENEKLSSSSLKSHKHKLTINSVELYAQEKHLILKEITLNEASESLTATEIDCDVACLVYDRSNPKSFDFIARVFIKYYADTHIPVLVVSNKSDLEEVVQNYTIQPAAFCLRYKIVSPQPFSSMQPIKRDIFLKLATMAAYPRFSAAWINFCKQKFLKLCQDKIHLKHLGSIRRNRQLWWKAGLSMAALTALGLIVIKAVTTERIK